MLHKFQHALQHFLTGLIYPFTQKQWPLRMWIFALLSYAPFLNIIIARGWRLELVHRVGWSYEQGLPAPNDVIKFIKNGLLLWMVTGLYLLIPIIITAQLGLNGWMDLYHDVVYLFHLSADFFWYQRISLGAYTSSMSSYLISDTIDTLIALLIQNIYLVIYLPIYRIAMIRFALSKKLLHSHLAVFSNLKFIYRNFWEIMLTYVFMSLDFIVLFMINGLLTMSVIGIPLIPIVISYMYYWYSGYEYGLLARRMVEQENIPLSLQPTEQKNIKSKSSFRYVSPKSTDNHFDLHPN